MKSRIKNVNGEIFLEVYPENADEETELVGIFLTDKVFVQDGLPEVEKRFPEEVARFKKLVFKLQKKSEVVEWK